MKMDVSLEQRHPLFLEKVQMSSGGERQCGLGSLLPMSCRGRAEAFARRLHTRLRRLGSEPRPGEDSWLTAQPSQRRHLSDSDVYFDFDIDLGSPSSPVDEVPEGAQPNGKAAPPDPESGFIFSSPAERDSPHSNSDSDAAYFDVEADTDSATNKNTNHSKYQTLYDENQAAMNIVNNKLKISASDIRDQLLNCKPGTPERQSPIKTQPLARENGYADYGSLDRAESKQTPNSLYSPIRFDDCQKRSSVERELPTAESDKVDSPGAMKLEDLFLDARSPTEEKDEVDFVVNLIEKCELSSRIKEIDAKLEARSEDYETNVSEYILNKIDVKIPKDEEFTSDEDGLQHKEKDTETDDAIEKLNLPDNDETTRADETLENTENDGENDDRPQRVRRCSSLRTGKTPPGTPGRKKIVRFADVLGLDLADVKTFMDDIPYIPKSAFEDLRDADLGLTVVENFAQPTNMLTPKDKRLVCMFQCPGDQPNFLDILNARSVCLENAVIQDGATIAICGTVRVRNLDFHKSVQIRYTLDSWKTFSDLQATYVPNSCDGFCDRFQFLLYAHTLIIGQKLEFAIRFMCKGCQFWDNNTGVNYCFQCVACGPQNNFYQPLSLTQVDNWHSSFY